MKCTLKLLLWNKTNGNANYHDTQNSYYFTDTNSHTYYLFVVTVLWLLNIHILQHVPYIANMILIYSYFKTIKMFPYYGFFLCGTMTCAWKTSCHFEVPVVVIFVCSTISFCFSRWFSSYIVYLGHPLLPSTQFSFVTHVTMGTFGVRKSAVLKAGPHSTSKFWTVRHQWMLLTFFLCQSTLNYLSVYRH